MCTSPNYMIFRGEFTKNDRPKYVFLGHYQYERMLDDLKGVPFIQVPCLKCLECRIQHARAWADRCVLEAKDHKYNYFLTLTYDDENIPPNGSLQPDDMTKFIKRLRKKLGGKVRYLYSGEYGDLSLRPHYHMIMFSDVPLTDLSNIFWMEVDGKMVQHIRPTSKNNDIYFSKTIYDCWQHQGMISVGMFSYDTAAYVSQYVTKKCNPNNDKKFKELGLFPEYMRVSTKPGIGAQYFQDHDELHFNGKLIIPSDGEAHLSAVPRYYDKLFQKKFGDDVFDKNVRVPRIFKKFNREDTYLHSSHNFDKEAEIRDHNIKILHHRKNSI